MRKLPMRPGSFPLRLSNPPQGTLKALLEMSRSRLKMPPVRSQKSAMTTMSVLSSPVPALSHASHSPMSLDAPKFVFQKEVDHAGNRVGAIHSRRAILQDVDVIDHREGNEVNVHAAAEPDGVQRTKGDTFSVNEHQGFFGQQAAQVELNGAVPASAGVQVLGSARLLWQKSCQVRCIADA